MSNRNYEKIDKHLEQLLMMNTHADVVRKVTSANTKEKFEVHSADKFTVIVPSDMKWGNKEDIMPCFVSHTDTVSNNKPTTLTVKNGVVRNPDGVLGADDRAGCYMLYKMIKNGVRGIYILTDEEECGGIGADECARSNIFHVLQDNTSALIELDRESDRDIALYGYDNGALTELFEQRDYGCAWGSYTDIVDLSKASGIASINLSVGYYRQHTKREYLVLHEMYHTLDMLLDNMPTELYREKYEAQGNFSFEEQYDMKDKILCDSCCDHAPLYETEYGNLCDTCCNEYLDTNPLYCDFEEDDTWYGGNFEKYMEKEEA